MYFPESHNYHICSSVECHELNWHKLELIIRILYQNFTKHNLAKTTHFINIHFKQNRRKNLKNMDFWKPCGMKFKMVTVGGRFLKMQFVRILVENMRN